MKITGTLSIVLSVLLAVLFIVFGIRAEYEWNNQYGSLWSLGVKASTIEQKSEYIDKFVAALDASGLNGVNDAPFFPTPDNSFDQNMIAIKSLQGRLHAIQKMDESSFQYQTAIQQITAQEQDDAGDMLGVLKNSWYKVHHYFYWNPWMGLVMFLLPTALLFIGIGLIAA